MATIGVIISKGPNAKVPYIEDEKAHRRLLKSLYNAIGKQSPYELDDETCGRIGEK